MTKVHSRLLSLATVLACATLATGCFTPSGYGAGEAGEHGGEAKAEQPEPPKASEADGEKIVEGIIPGSKGKKLEIKAPEIPYEAPFDGEALSSKTLENDVKVEEFVLGTGDEVAENKLVEFAFKGYSGVNATQVMGSRAAPAKMVINDATRKRDPIAAAMADAMLGMKVGGKRRVMVPASIIEKDAPVGRPPIGDLWMTVEIVSVTDAPVLFGAEAYTGEPVATKKLDNGLEIIDFKPGEGREAKTGDLVVAHYIGQLTDGTEFDSSHGRAEGLPAQVGADGMIAGFAQGIEGARVGMLRKLVIPPALGYGEREQGKIPANSTLVFYLQIVEVKDAPPMPAMPGAPTPPPTPTDGAEAAPAGGTPAAGGTKLDSAGIKTGVDTVKKAAKGCAAKHDGAGSKVAVQFKVEGATGKVVSAKATGEFAGTELGKCVEDEAKKATFPTFADAQQSFKFNFNL